MTTAFPDDRVAARAAEMTGAAPRRAAELSQWSAQFLASPAVQAEIARLRALDADLEREERRRDDELFHFFANFATWAVENDVPTNFARRLERRNFWARREIQTGWILLAQRQFYHGETATGWGPTMTTTRHATDLILTTARTVLVRTQVDDREPRFTVFKHANYRERLDQIREYVAAEYVSRTQ